MRAGLLALWLAAPWATAGGEEPPIVRAEIEPATIVVGQPARLRITVLVPTWFSASPEYPSLALPNALIRLPPDSSYPTSERIEGSNWSGIVRDYQVYPLLAGRYRLEGLQLSASYVDPDQGSEPITRTRALPTIDFRGQVPAGAEGLDPFLAGTRLELVREVDGDPGTLQTGAALTLRYRLELHGLSALFLPPLSADLSIPGVSVYPREPVIEDGDPARRSEEVTLVFERAGEVTVPGLALDWWNTRSGQLETAALAPLRLAVAGPPPSLTQRMADAGLAGRRLLLPLLALGALLALVYRRLPACRRSLRERRERYRRSEAHAFRALRRQLHAGQPAAAHRALLDWLARLEPPTEARDLAREFGDPELQAGIEALSRSLYRPPREAGVDAAGLSRGLAAARRRYRRRRAGSGVSALPPMNPGAANGRGRPLS